MRNMEISTEITRHKKKPILGIGITLLAASLITYLIFLFLPLSGTRWKIAVSGNQLVSRKDIVSAVSSMIQEQASPLEVESGLVELNPVIEKANVKVDRFDKMIEIRIKELDIALIKQRASQIIYFSKDNTILAENASIWPNTLDTGIPIFYLTSGKDNSESFFYRKKLAYFFSEARRDIIQLQKATRKDYRFVWQRISEIRLIVVNGSVKYEIYPVHRRARISGQIAFDKSFLARLWAVFVFLQRQKHDQRKIEIELSKKNALVRKVI